MKAIILAAGASVRLRPLTDDNPKCLLDINGFCMLERMLASLRENAIDEVIIVTGYLSGKIEDLVAERFQDMKVTYIHNELYASTNNSYSLWLAKDEVNEDFIQIDSDVLFDAEILTLLINSNHKNCLVIDTRSPLTEEAMKVIVSEESKIMTLNKDIDLDRSHGEFIGIAKFSPRVGGLLFEYIDNLVQQGETNEYYEAGYQELIDSGIPLYAVDTGYHKWIEIDTADDLQAARGRFSTQERTSK